MYKIFKNEIEYFIVPIIIIGILPLSFTFAALNDMKAFTEIYFLKKYFWSAVIGLGVYGLVFMIWSLRIKEMRERLHSMIPLTINKVSLVRWLLGIAPFVLIGLFIELLRGLLPSEQIIFIARINGQLGMMFVAIVVFDLIINSWYALGSKKYDKRIVYIVLITIVAALLSFGVVYSLTTAILKPIGFFSEESYFFLWGIILSIIDAFVFTKRKIYLS